MNFEPDIRSTRGGLGVSASLGGVPASWAATTEFNFGKDLIYDFLEFAQTWCGRSIGTNPRI